MELLKTQSNSLFEAIREAGFNPKDFQWEDIRDAGAKRIRHSPSKFYFSLYTSEIGRSPGKDKLLDSFKATEWGTKLKLFKEWLRLLKEEYEAPDLWKILSLEPELSEATQEDDNHLFSEQEKKDITLALGEIKEYLITAQGIDKSLVEPKLKYLEESTERLGRKDWINITYATIINIIIAATVNTNSAQEILGFVGAALQRIFENPPLLLP